MGRFSKPPLTDLEKEKKAEEFINFSNTRYNVSNISDLPNSLPVDSEKKDDLKNIRVTEKEKLKAFSFRFPVSIADNLAEISAITGFSMNLVCVELLRVATKNKLKDLKEDI